MSGAGSARFDARSVALQALGWTRSFMKSVQKRLRDLRALVRDLLGKLAPDPSLGQPA